jgi:preprotein translocase subunit SecA
MNDVINGYIDAETSTGFSDDWDLDRLWTALKTLYPITITPDELVEEAGGRGALTAEFLREQVTSDIHHAYDRREEELGAEVMREVERRVVLSVLDRKWREHLYEMDYLQEGIGLRAMAQRDPLVEYQREGFLLFEAMNESIKEESVGYLFNIQVELGQEEQQPAVQPASVTDMLAGSGVVPDAAPAATRSPDGTAASDGQPALAREATAEPVAPSEQERHAPLIKAKGLEQPVRVGSLHYSAPTAEGGVQEHDVASGGKAELPAETFEGTPRNAPCPCGSGKKYKMCHGAAR